MALLKRKHKHNEDEYKRSIIYFLEEIESVIDGESYEQLVYNGITESTLVKINDIIYKKYHSKIDIIQIELKDYIRYIESENDFYKLSTSLPFTIALFSIFYTLNGDNENILIAIAIFSFLFLSIRIYEKKREKHLNEYNSKSKLAYIVLDIIELNVNKVDCKYCLHQKIQNLN